MLHAVTFKIEGICGPAGYVDTSRDKVIRHAKSIAEVALDQMGDGVSFHEWFDLEGNEAEPFNLLQSADLIEVENIVVQISDAMKGEGSGCIDVHEYSDLFQLIEDQNFDSWCSASLKDRITEVKRAYFSLIQAISDEWIE